MEGKLRDILKLQHRLLILLSLLLVFGLTGCGSSDDIVTNVGELQFEKPLNIPELLEPTIDSDGTKHFNLTMEPGTTAFFPGKKDRYMGNQWFLSWPND